MDKLAKFIAVVFLIANYFIYNTN